MRATDIATVSFPDIVLEKIKVTLSVDVADAALMDMTLEQRASVIADRMTYQIRGYLLGMEHQVHESETVEAEEFVPLSWWDHAKAAFRKRWPRWAQRIAVHTRLIQTRVHRRSSVWHVCPHAEHSRFPGRHADFMQYDGRDGYSPLNIEAEAREAVESWRAGGTRDLGARMIEFDRAMHALMVAIDRADRDKRA